MFAHVRWSHRSGEAWKQTKQNKTKHIFGLPFKYLQKHSICSHFTASLLNCLFIFNLLFNSYHPLPRYGPFRLTAQAPAWSLWATTMPSLSTSVRCKRYERVLVSTKSNKKNDPRDNFIKIFGSLSFFLSSSSIFSCACTCVSSFSPIKNWTRKDLLIWSCVLSS